MSDHEEDLLSDNLNLNKKGGTDLADAVNLFKTVIDSQFAALSKQLLSEQNSSAQSLTKKLKDNPASKLRGEGNRIQFNFNEEISDELDNLRKIISDNPSALSLVKEIKEKIAKRNKLIRIADSSPAGWRTVNEYETNDYADDSDDDKRIRSAETRAMRSKNRGRGGRIHPYSRSTPAAAAGSAAQLPVANLPSGGMQPFRGYGGSHRTPQPTDICFRCFQYGHWKNRCPLNFSAQQGSMSGTSSAAGQK